jgi:hypothetical protein
MPEFYILNLRTNLPMRDAHDTTILYNTGGEAAAAAAAFTDVTGDKCQPRLFQLDENWQTREQLRLISGEYTPLPWDTLALVKISELEPPQRDDLFYDYEYQLKYNWFYSRRKPEARRNFPHVSKIKRGNIAYTESADRGRRNLKTSIRPGRYLDRFYSLNNDNIRHYASEFMAQFGELKLLFAKTIEELDFVYKRDIGPNSCMTYELNCYVDHYPPTRVYAASDLSVAYIAQLDDEEKPERVLARCVVWPEKKLFGRAYGDVEKLHGLLRKEGYQSGSFRGATLPKIPSSQEGEWYMPYLDGDYHVKDKGDHWIITGSGGDAKADSTTGTISLGVWCDCCDRQFRASRMVHIIDIDETWCNHCVDERAFHCFKCGEYYDTNTTSLKIILPYEQNWCENCSDGNVDLCTATETYWKMKDLVEMHGGDYWCREYFYEHGAACKLCHLNLSKDKICKTRNEAEHLHCAHYQNGEQ